ncbi:hypothetical protein ACFPRL_16565 [Pseudoclavibacter helvolus]
MNRSQRPRSHTTTAQRQGSRNEHQRPQHSVPERAEARHVPRPRDRRRRLSCRSAAHRHHRDHDGTGDSRLHHRDDHRIHGNGRRLVHRLRGRSPQVQERRLTRTANTHKRGTVSTWLAVPFVFPETYAFPSARRSDAGQCGV